MSNYNEKMFSKEFVEDKPTIKKAKRKLRKWVKGAAALVIALGIAVTSSSLVNTFKADALSSQLAGGLHDAAIVMHNDEQNPDNVTYGYSAIGLDEFAKEVLNMAEYGQVDPHVLVASCYREADYAHGYEDEIPTMNEIFKRTHGLIYGHEDEYSPEVKAAFNYPSLEAYFEANNSNARDYHAEARKILVIAAKNGCNSQEINDFLNEHGFINDSGGRI